MLIERPLSFLYLFYSALFYAARLFLHGAHCKPAKNGIVVEHIVPTLAEVECAGGRCVFAELAVVYPIIALLARTGDSSLQIDACSRQEDALTSGGGSYAVAPNAVVLVPCPFAFLDKGLEFCLCGQAARCGSEFGFHDFIVAGIIILVLLGRSCSEVAAGPFHACAEVDKLAFANAIFFFCLNRGSGERCDGRAIFSRLRADGGICRGLIFVGGLRQEAGELYLLDEFLRGSESLVINVVFLICFLVYGPYSDVVFIVFAQRFAGGETERNDGGIVRPVRTLFLS